MSDNANDSGSTPLVQVRATLVVTLDYEGLLPVATKPAARSLVLSELRRLLPGEFRMNPRVMPSFNEIVKMVEFDEP